MAGFYEQIVEQHYGTIFNFLHRLCGRRDLAEDLTQETFLRLWNSPPPQLDAEGARRWLYTVARNLAVSYFRSAGATRGADWEGIREPVSPLASPAEDGMARELSENVRCAVQSLPRVLREAIVLREFEGLSYEEMGVILSVPMGTVRSRLSRARAALAERLAPIKETL